MAAQQRELQALANAQKEDDGGGWTQVGWGKTKGKGKEGGKAVGGQKGGQKGKGKGKSKGAGGSWGAAAGNDRKSWGGKGGAEPWGMPKKEDWPCRRRACKVPAGKLNFGRNDKCNWCGVPKNAAMNPPRGERSGAAEEPEAVEVEADENETGEADSMEDAKPATLKGDEVAMLRAMGLSIIRPRDEKKAIFPKPLPLDEKKSADEEVANLCKTSDLLAVTVENVEFYRAEAERLETVVKEATTEVEKRNQQRSLEWYRTRLKEEEKTASDLGKKKNATGEAQLHELTAKKSQADALEAVRIQKEAKEAADGLERFQRLEAVMMAQTKLMEERLEALREEYKAAASLAAERVTETAKRHVERTAAWTSRISVADRATGGLASLPVEPASLAEAKSKRMRRRLRMGWSGTRGSRLS